jgi:hypothetical protein
VDGLQVAARERVEELQARERRVGRVMQGAVLGARLECLLQSHAVDHLGKLGERREDARGRPLRAVSDEGARVITLEEEFGGAEGEVLHRHKVSVAFKVVAEAEATGRERRLRATDAAQEAHGHGHNGRGGGRVAAEEELALARMPRAHLSFTMASRSTVIIALLVVGVMVMVMVIIASGCGFGWCPRSGRLFVGVLEKSDSKQS